MSRRILLGAFLALFSSSLFSQGFPITGGLQTIDFTGFTGAGFAPSPAAGQLDSDYWAVTGWSNGDLAFGGTQTTANTDYTRGVSTGGVTPGGMYAFDVGGGNFVLGIQPGGSDFAPGTLTLRITNTSGQTITSLGVSYDLYYRNDQPRANSFNFSHSANNSTYTNEATLDFTSPAALDALGWQSVSQPITLTGLNIANNETYYIRWSSADVSGTGSRDEFGLDNITFTFGTPPILTSFSPDSGDQGTYVTIEGSDFISFPGVSDVLFNGVSASFQVISDTEIHARVPDGASTGSITISKLGLTDSDGPFTLLTTSNAGCPAVLSDLIISEYIEGTSNNKAIEIYNGTGADITFDGSTNDYKILIYANGSSIATSTIDLTNSSSITNNGVYIIGHASANASITGVANQSTTSLNFNGNDAVVLVNGSTVIDVIGQIGTDPGTEWTGGGISTLNRTLRRKSAILTGDTDGSNAFDPSVEWDGYAVDTFGGLGSHSVVGTPTPLSIQPSSICADASSGTDVIQFTANAPDATYYQWRKWNGAAWINIDANTDGSGVHLGFNSNTLSVDVTESGDGARYGDQYYCQVGTSATCYTNSNVVYILDASTSCGNPLPVTYTYFKASSAETTATLAWQTATEINNEGFEVQKSLDGQHFTAIGFVQGHGNSDELHSYQFSDTQFYQSAYYRLRQIDTDGEAEYSKMLFVEQSTGQARVLAFPNPYSSNMNLHVPEEAYQLRIVDFKGREVVNKWVNRATAEQHLNRLGKGTYFIQISTPNVQQTVRVVRQ